MLPAQGVHDMGLSGRPEAHILSKRYLLTWCSMLRSSPAATPSFLVGTRLATEIDIVPSEDPSPARRSIH
ncbi:hypothetical protein EJ05DRAFT_481134 [Pseudovirgaria hyperparasitica]|uniref:Uncharacterized protein n=1 Tax=Pseudovirgaria hyperparasitica TaxID=470096 RepID=A0A6A6VPS5_9PEZI|nr:uncharacterized protein EJ05DRAFT_481271 [Pseudovirgaria hyperparasitica]XP_033595089.1 uncharacterized protein EJ05DRAFT_481134 [Pseudovirgaria hyperparasitica]KAF2752469.1 hypothetical protein EJ05DRAFT_481271 [Pseudovirgaria hyperparasitica]KAF2752638.1 hypothetical protein EJ05DRAFT_481134 [Pseudovirgaria hyperparasitica]